jgi:hypothetical protein
MAMPYYVAAQRGKKRFRYLPSRTALEDWLSDQGVKNINPVNDAIMSAKP